MTDEPTNIVPIKALGKVPALPVVSSMKMVAIIAADLPPALPEGMNFKRWLELTHEFIGSHPEVVLVSARDAILSTFVFAPKKAEIIGAILDAYRRLGVALSEDGRKHLSFRETLNKRYSLNADGEKRFAEHVVVFSIGNFYLNGAQANLLIDEIVGATVEDAEKAIAPVTASFAAADKGGINNAEVLARLKAEIGRQGLYRLHGTPEQNCGGVVAKIAYGSNPALPLSLPLLALSTTFVDLMRDRYPHARAPSNQHSWTAAIWHAFTTVSISRNLDRSTYGCGMQQQAEAMIDEAMRQLNLDGRRVIEREIAVDRKDCGMVLNAIVAAETRLKAGEAVASRVVIGRDSMLLDSDEACAIARRKLDSHVAKIERRHAEIEVKP